MPNTPIGLNVPAGTDPFDPQTDFADLASSLMGQTIVPAANTTARDQIRDAVAATGIGFATRPLLVYVIDQAAIQRWDGSAWIDIARYISPGGAQRTSDLTIGPGAMTTVVSMNYTFRAGVSYYVLATGQMSIGGAKAAMYHRIVIGSNVGLTYFYTFPTVTDQYTVITSSMMSPGAGVQNVRLEVQLFAPATGVNVYSGHSLFIWAVG